LTREGTDGMWVISPKTKSTGRVVEQSGRTHKYQNNKLWEIWGDEALLLYGEWRTK